MATAVQVTQDEMEELLLPQGFHKMELEGVHELVYGKRVGEFSLRIYTTLNPNGKSREVGRDAIRPILYWRSAGGNIHVAGKAKRVHRTTNWRKNLQERIDNWASDVGPRCAACGSPMVQRKSAHGEFWGCVMYRETKCKGKPKNA